MGESAARMCVRAFVVLVDMDDVSTTNTAVDVDAKGGHKGYRGVVIGVRDGYRRGRGERKGRSSACCIRIRIETSSSTRATYTAAKDLFEWIVIPTAVLSIPVAAGRSCCSRTVVERIDASKGARNNRVYAALVLLVLVGPITNSHIMSCRSICSCSCSCSCCLCCCQPWVGTGSNNKIGIVGRWLFRQQIVMVPLKDGKQVGLLFAQNGIPIVVVIVMVMVMLAVGRMIVVVHHRRSLRPRPRRVWRVNYWLAGWLASSKSKNVVGIDRSLLTCRSTTIVSRSRNLQCCSITVYPCLSWILLRAFRLTL